MPAALIERLPLFRELDAAASGLVGELFRPVDFHRGAAVDGRGGQPGWVMLLTSGRLRVITLTVTGREVTLHRHCAGSVAGLHHLVAEAAGPVSLETVAETDGRLARATADEVLAAMGRHPSLAVTLLGEAVRQLRDAEDFARRVCHSTVEARVAAALLELNLPTEGAPVLREYLASRAAVTRESVSRALQRLAARGLVGLGGRTISVADERALRRAAAPGGSVPCYGSPPGAGDEPGGLCPSPHPYLLSGG